MLHMNLKRHTTCMKKLKLQWIITCALVLLLWPATLLAQLPLVEQISSNFITSFAEDPKGYIWIGTNHGLNRFSGSNYTVYYAQKDSTALNSDYVNNLMFDADNRLWMSNECGLCMWQDGVFRHPQRVGFNPIGRVLDLDREWLVVTDRKGVAKVNKLTLKEEKYYPQPGMSNVTAITISSQKQVWTANALQQATDIYILDENLNLLRTLHGPKDTYIRDIVEDTRHRMWVTTNKGLLCYDAKTWEELPVPDELAEAVRDKRIHFLLPYRQDFLLIGIAGEGMYRYDVARRILTRLHAQQRLKAQNYVCFIDSNNGIWLSDQENDFQYYPERAAFNNLSSIFEHLTDPFVKNLQFDREGYLWMRSSHDLASYDTQADKIAFHLPDDNRYGYGYIFIDSKNRLWVIRNRLELRQYAISKGKIVREEHRYTFPANVFSVSEDKEGRIWVTLSDRFAMLAADGKFTYRYAPGGITFSQLQTLQPSGTMILYTVNNGLYKFGEDQQFIPLDSLYLPNPNSLTIDRNNTYWIGTYNTGLVHYDPYTQRMERFDTSSGLIDNSLKAVAEDKKGNIWFSSSTHIGRYDVQEKTFSYLYDNHFSKGKLYALNCVAVAPDGTLFFGGSGGITAIYPNVPMEKNPDIPLHLDMVLVNGSIYNGNEEKLSLSHQENMVTFYYSALKFEAGFLLNYAYMLEGFDKDWIDAGANKRVAYSNLPAGKYTLRVKARMLNGEWCKNELTKEVIVHPAPWAAPWAIALYWLAGIGLAVLAIRLIIRWRTQEERLALAERQKEINQAHIDFVTNISHEVRTPLAMVYAPLKELAKDNNLNEHERGLVDIMLRNAERLLRLVQQLLDTKTGEKDEKQLRVAMADLTAFIQAQTANFRFIAHEKGLTVNLHAGQDTVACFDAEKVEKIFYNLLSNAIKYTPEGGSIDITVDSDGKNAHIRVADTGQGIPPEKREQLFGRFERLGADKKYPKVNGKGIGLNYAQYLAHLHKGDIGYTPNQPQGACFTLCIPQSLTAYSPEERVQGNEYQMPLPKDEIRATEKDTPKENTLLIAEDDQEVREYLRALLATDYNVIAVENGEEAIDGLGMNLPDLIISDVVMPGKDGYELCKAVKTSPDWGHIPFILLTAKNDTDSSIKGLDCGADAYVGKPFDPFYLKAAISNLLENRKRMHRIVQNLTSENLSKGKAREAMLDEQDRQFLENLHALLDKHLDDEDFSITSLAKEMLVSYSSLYARIKSLTGQTPQNFLNTYRMNTAMQLLKSGKYNVSEVSYKVGASSVANFSRSFKRQFGIPPSEV